MKVKGLNGRTYNWQLVGNDNSTAVSGPHLKVRALLKTMFPGKRVIEELYLPGTKKLRVDFFLPSLSLLVEVHGRQHFEFVSHFHGDVFGYLKSIERDENKKEFAVLNNFGLAELHEGEFEDVWRSKILEAIG